MINEIQYRKILNELTPKNVQLVAVSKTKPVEDLAALYQLGQRDFGENYVQELLDKHHRLPPDIRWHFIGHLQTNKVKQVIGVCELIHGVDRIRLLDELQKQAMKIQKVQKVLLQVFIAREETKFGMDETELNEVISLFSAGKYPNVQVVGLMGMASNTNDSAQILEEFGRLRILFEKCSASLPDCSILSMGMSQDYALAVQSGSTMVRIGSLLFGKRS